MRTKEEIEESFVDITAPAGSEELYKTFLEILLDIRELLKGMREQTLYEAVSEARQEEKSRRQEKVRERLRPTGGE